MEQEIQTDNSASARKNQHTFKPIKPLCDLTIWKKGIITKPTVNLAYRAKKTQQQGNPRSSRNQVTGWLFTKFTKYSDSDTDIKNYFNQSPKRHFK